MSKKRKPTGNPLFEHYSHMAELHRGEVTEFRSRAIRFRGKDPSNERIALENMNLSEQKALHYAQLAEKEKPVENPN